MEVVKGTPLTIPEYDQQLEVLFGADRLDCTRFCPLQRLCSSLNITISLAVFSAACDRFACFRPCTFALGNFLAAILRFCGTQIRHDLISQVMRDGLPPWTPRTRAKLTVNNMPLFDVQSPGGQLIA